MGGPKRASICQVCAVEFTYSKFIEPLACALFDRGYRVHAVFANELTIADASTSGESRVLIHHVPIERSLSLVALLRSTFFLYRLFSSHSFDAVHVHTPIASISARLAARLARVPVVLYTVHGFYFHDLMPAPLRCSHIALEWFLARFTTEIFAVSAEDAAAARRLNFLPPDRIHVIANGVNSSRFAPSTVDQRDASRRRFGLRHDGLVIGIVARLVCEKGYPQLLSAFERIAVLEPRAQLLICGSRLSSDHADGIESCLAALRPSTLRQVLLSGELEDVEVAYQAMDIFCLPSWREGLPCTILEAMMSGLPVVATAIRGCREAVVPGLTGLLVPPRQTEPLVTTLLDLLSDPRLRQQFGEAGRARALALYESEAVMARQLALVDQALARAR
jgi:glycosyltransferase involved in cell wall biosynthesis